MDEVGQETGPAACFVPAESERPAWREVGRSQAARQSEMQTLTPARRLKANAATSRASTGFLIWK